jgi:hypothetical protein
MFRNVIFCTEIVSHIYKKAWNQMSNTNFCQLPYTVRSTFLFWENHFTGSTNAVQCVASSVRLVNFRVVFALLNGWGYSRIWRRGQYLGLVGRKQRDEVVNYVMKSTWSYTSTNILTVIQIKEGKVRGSGGTHADEKCLQDFGGEACRKRPFGSRRSIWNDNKVLNRTRSRGLD